MKPIEFTAVDSTTSESWPVSILPVPGMLWFPVRRGDGPAWKGHTKLAIPGQAHIVVREDQATVSARVIDAIRVSK
jgi:hypothetical protein